MKISVSSTPAILAVFLLLFTTLLVQELEAKVFRNAYVAFELPDNWKCALEQTEWVCRSEIEKQAREAIIILTAKEVGPTDNFALYETHLNTPKMVPSRQGTPQPSKVYYKAKMVQINDHKWLDGLHLGSEVPNYFTRYLATMKDRIAILVTFSAHKLQYTKYSKDFFRAVNSLRVVASKGLLDRNQEVAGLRPGSETLGGPLGVALPGGEIAGTDLPPPPPETKGGNSKKGILFGLAIILAAFGIYLFINSKK